jgi:hypothetical protein
MHTCYCNENSRNPGLQLDPTQQINSKPKQQNRIKHNLPNKVLRHAPVDVLLFLTSEKPFVFGGRELFCAAEFGEEGGCNRWRKERG